MDLQGGRIIIFKVIIAEKLWQFINEYGNDRYHLELLQFFGAYPNTRFSGLAILHALSVDSGRLNIEKALRHLMDKGVVRKYIENNVPLYSLTGDESLHSLALDLAKLDWHQWRLVLRQI